MLRGMWRIKMWKSWDYKIHPRKIVCHPFWMRSDRTMDMAENNRIAMSAIKKSSRDREALESLDIVKIFCLVIVIWNYKLDTHFRILLRYYKWNKSLPLCFVKTVLKKDSVTSTNRSNRFSRWSFFPFPIGRNRFLWLKLTTILRSLGFSAVSGDHLPSRPTSRKNQLKPRFMLSPTKNYL